MSPLFHEMASLNPLRRYPLASFFILAYGIAWIPAGLLFVTGADFLLITSFAPAISALVVVVVSEGRAGTEALLSKLFRWRAGLKWYLIALLTPVALELLAILTHQLLGKSSSTFQLGNWLQVLPAQLPWLFLILLFLVPLSAGEELGWRGFAMPRLQAHYGSVWASLILGLLWGFWHLPAFFIPGAVQNGLPIPGYVLATVGYAFIYTSILNGSKGSVLLTSLYHAASNLTLSYGNAFFPTVIGELYLSLPALAILAIVVVVIGGPRVFSDRHP